MAARDLAVIVVSDTAIRLTRSRVPPPRLLRAAGTGPAGSA
ncbi:MAG: hypothetical protein ACWA6X_02195 [Bauldia sp.]